MRRFVFVFGQPSTAVSGRSLPRATSLCDQWNRIKELMRDETTTSVEPGAFNSECIKSDYEMVKTYFGMEQPFDRRAPTPTSTRRSR